MKRQAITVGFSASIIEALTARTIYEETAARRAYGIDPARAEAMRKQYGGNIVPFPHTVLRWYPADVEKVMAAADAGLMSPQARLWRATWVDGKVRGVLSTRTGGLVALPRRFEGPEAQVSALERRLAGRQGFDEVCPPVELAMFAADLIGLGVAVGELVPCVNRAAPLFVRLDPEHLRYDRTTNCWYYDSIAGPELIQPGNGRWVFGTYGGRVNPWHYGIVAAVGASWIRKLHAQAYDANWQSKLANPARVATSPSAASSDEREGWFQAVAAWGVNSVFEAPPGYEVSLLESNGRGHEAFRATIKESNSDIIVAITGQEVTTDGGAGFQNSDIFKAIRADLIKETADALAYVLNTQVMPVWAYLTFGTAANCASVSWDVTPPKDKSAVAQALVTAGNALTTLNSALAEYGQRVNVDAFVSTFGLHVDDVPPTDAKVRLELGVDAIASVVRVDEARASQNLPPIGDERGLMTITQLETTTNAATTPPASGPVRNTPVGA